MVKGDAIYVTGVTAKVENPLEERNELSYTKVAAGSYVLLKIPFSPEIDQEYWEVLIKERWSNSKKWKTTLDTLSKGVVDISQTLFSRQEQDVSDKKLDPSLEESQQLIKKLFESESLSFISPLGKSATMEYSSLSKAIIF